METVIDLSTWPPPFIYQVEIGKVIEKADVKVMRVHQAIDTEFITNDLA